MNYYEISNDPYLENQIKPNLSDVKNIWSSDQPILVPGSIKQPKRYSYFTPILNTTPILISNQVKQIWETYQTRVFYRPCALYCLEQKQIEVYWFAKLLCLNGIDQQTEYSKMGTIDRLILSKKKIGAHKIFVVQHLHKNYLIVDLEVLEQMLRHNQYGYRFKLIESV